MPAPDARADPGVIAAEVSAWVAEQRTEMMRRWCEQSLSTPNLHVLLTLAPGPMTMSHLADVREMSLSNATGIVTRMEDRGLVERVREEHDRRLVMVRLTPAGQAIVDDLEFIRHRQLIRILAAMSPAERSLFGRAFRAFAATSRRLSADELADRPTEPSAQPCADSTTPFAAPATPDHPLEGVANR